MYLKRTVQRKRRIFQIRISEIARRIFHVDRRLARCRMTVDPITDQMSDSEGRMRICDINFAGQRCKAYPVAAFVPINLV